MRYQLGTLFWLCLCFAALSMTNLPASEKYIEFDDSAPHCWWDIRWTWMQNSVAEACTSPTGAWPDSGLFNEAIVGRDRTANFGYPYHYALVSGINDTLDALIWFYNPPSPFKDYDLTGKKVEQWFAPQAYRTYVNDLDSPALMDSTQLGYRMRGWYDGWKPLAPITKLHNDTAQWGRCGYGHYSIKLDIWNLPQGKFQLCLLPTDKIPNDLHALISGSMIEYYPARDLADSCNGYEGCYWRAQEDSDFTTAKNYVGKILTINPKSVPGWWLKAENALDLQDTLLAKAAYDSAIVYLNNAADSAMPDSTKHPLLQYEKLYIECLQAILPYNRAQLGP